MRRYILSIFALMVVAVCANAQKIVSGSFEPLKGLTRMNLVYDYSQTTINRMKGLTVEELAESDEGFKKDKAKGEKWCSGSINDELDGRVLIAPGAKADIQMVIRVDKITRDFDDPEVTVLFTNAAGETLVTITDISDDDLNGVGHIIGKFVKRQLRKLK